MFEKLLVLSFITAISALPIDSTHKANQVIDKILLNLKQHNEVKISGYENVSIIGLENLKRIDDCIRSSNNKFICRAETKEATIGGDGDKYTISLIYSFSVRMDESGAVQEVNVVDVEIESNQTFYGFWSKLWNKIKQVAKVILVNAAKVLVAKAITSG